MSPLEYMIAQPDAIPQELKDLPHWVTWDPELVGDRWTKVLKNPRTGSKASSTDSATWSTLDHALKRNPSRVGFVLTKSGFLVIDLDHCVVDGIIEEWAWKIIRRIGSYAEISVSGTGVHIIIRGQLPPGRRRIGQIETYDDGRYVTVTGATIDGYTTMATDDGRVAAWYAETFPAKVPTPIRPRLHTETHLEDDDLLERARNARNGASFIALYDHGDLSAHGNNHSAADQALMNRLAFWFGCDTDRMEQRFTDSALGQREKWRARADYRRRTIDKAIQDCQETYSPKHNEPPPPLPQAEPVHHDGVPTSAAGSCPAQLAAARQRITELEEQLATAEAGIAVRDETIARQAARLDQYSVTQTVIEKIVATDQIDAGPKVTAIALQMELAEQQQRGKPAAELGRHIPGVWIARRRAGPLKTANGHLKKMADAGLIDRRVVKERVLEDTVDPDTGEIVPRGKTISRTYYPDQASALITRFTSYRRPDDAPKHGGKRTPACTNHPNASTTTTHTTRCDECNAVLDEDVTHRHPTECEPQDGVSTPPVVNPKGPPKMGFPPENPKMGLTLKSGGPHVARVRRLRPVEPPPSRDYRDEDAPSWIGGDR